MKVSSILSKTKEVSSTDKRTLFYLMFAAIIGGIVTDLILTIGLRVHPQISNLCAIMVSVFFQGMYLFVLQCLNHESEKLTVFSAIKYGINKFFKNIITYVIYNIIQFGIIYLTMTIFGPIIFRSLIFTDYLFLHITFMIILSIILLVILSFIGLTFYVIERYPDTRGIYALIKSSSLLKGYRLLTIKVNIIYALQVVIISFAYTVATMYISNIVGALVLLLFVLMLIARYILVDLLIANGIIFEEVYYNQSSKTHEAE